MKCYKKSDLTFKNGYILDAEGNVVSPGFMVVSYLNSIETQIQKDYWTKGQTAAASEMHMKQEPFIRASITDVSVESILPEVETKALDKAVKRSMAICKDLDKLSNQSQVMSALKNMTELVMFLQSDEFMGSTEESVKMIDTPIIGNPLELTAEKLAELMLAYK